MPWLILAPALILLAISLINFLSIHSPNKDQEIKDLVSVLVPLRNEAENVVELVRSLDAQKSLPNVEFFLLDDNSTDETLALLTATVSGLPNFHLIQGAPLPEGWIGKTWALRQMLEASHGEVVVSIDADVRITPDAISKSIVLMNSLGLDFLSPYPRQIAKTFGERMIQPLLQWSWMATLILPLAQRSTFSSMAVANGQFFVVKRTALVQAGGYECVKASVLDDVFLARELVKKGARGVVANGSGIATCRMYSSWSEIEAGYGKSLRHAFGSVFGSLIAVLFLFITGLAPIILALSGYSFGVLAYGLVTLTRVLSALRSRTNIVDSLLHPVSCAMLIYLIFYSYLMRSQIKWKGRTL